MGALLTSRLTSSSSLLSLSVGVDMPVLAPLALCVAALNAVRLLSMLGLPSLKGVEGSGLVILDLETPAPEGFEDDQYPTPGFRCFSMSWTEDWILRISSLSVLLLFFSLSPYDLDSSNCACSAAKSACTLARSARAARYKVGQPSLSAQAARRPTSASMATSTSPLAASTSPLSRFTSRSTSSLAARPSSINLSLSSLLLILSLYSVSFS